MEKKITTRRLFLSNSAKATLAITAGIASARDLKSGIQEGLPTPGINFDTGFKQEPLPYAYNALDKAIDAMTMEIHYSKHAAAYSANLQDAAKAEGADMNKPVEDVLAKISKYSAKMRNNGGGHYNHELFWKSMTPNGTENPSGKLLAAIEQSFSSFDSFKTQFSDAGKNRFGSGWAWLYLDGDKKLKIGSTPNQDNPLMDVSDIKGLPVLGLDVWEHAYYLRYQNKRPDYIANWWKVVNWDFVQKRYASMV
ncbi:MAG TPA: superoxide dismutase [Chitinophagaceae bacterium]|nr:superoxide dismutase [Chitinophagaceae bacterium]